MSASRSNRDFFRADAVLGIFCAWAAAWLVFLPATAAQGAFAAFFIVSALWLRMIGRRQLEGIAVFRNHPQRVFQGDEVEVALDVRRGAGPPVALLQIEDLFHASLQIETRHLIPLVKEGWTVRLRRPKLAERHRGLYLSGPVTLAARDPLGVYEQRRRLPVLTHLTVYPQADPLPDYRVPGPRPPSGVSLDDAPRAGQGEEALGVREYARGDSPSTVHWRTSARRGKLHVLQRNTSIQIETAVMIDLTRRSRHGLGADAAEEKAIQAAISVLTRVYEARHRFSLSIAHETEEHFPAAAGLANLHLLLDRLAVIAPLGETEFWPMAARRAFALRAGSRAVFIAVAQLTPTAETARFIEQLAAIGVAADCILIDARAFIRLYRDQEPDMTPTAPWEGESQANELRRAGARVWRVERGEAVGEMTNDPAEP